MKKNVMMRIASVLMIAVLLTTCVISGTFAKYTSTASGTSTKANIAKWSFTAEDVNIAETNSFTFELFATANIKDSDGSAEEDVKADNIAPGTTGSIILDLANTSEVTATYAITFSESTHDIPIEYTLTPDVAESWKASITQISKSADLLSGATAQVTVYWRWAYEGDDTTIGVNADTNNAENLTVTASITATQKD